MLAVSDLERWLKTVEAGRPACVFADDVADARNSIEQLATSEAEPARVVALSWHEVPPLGNEVELLSRALAEAALALYPSLYGTTQATRARWLEADVESEAHEIVRRVPGVLGPACRQILLACRRNDQPHVKRLSNAETVRQLALAIEPHRLVVVIAALAAETGGVRLRSLAQGAEWLATNTRSRVVLVVPTSLRGATDLDHVTYSACQFASSAEPPEEVTQESGSNIAKENDRRGEPEVLVSAATGRPHPASEAECELHRWLTNDSQLANLFAFNQPIKTRYGTSPMVDLVWHAGKLVIEIDGDDHRRPQKFIQDRQRDYELLMSGYHVVRFTNASVLAQTETVVGRIRDAVAQFSKREQGP